MSDPCLWGWPRAFPWRVKVIHCSLNSDLGTKQIFPFDFSPNDASWTRKLIFSLKVVAFNNEPFCHRWFTSHTWTLDSCRGSSNQTAGSIWPEPAQASISLLALDVLHSLPGLFSKSLGPLHLASSAIHSSLWWGKFYSVKTSQNCGSFSPPASKYFRWRLTVASQRSSFPSSTRVEEYNNLAARIKWSRGWESTLHMAINDQ